jgi:hypothetical protein
MADGVEGGFDFEALDDDSSELSALVTATPSSSVAGEEGNVSSLLQIEEEGALDTATVKGLATSLSSLRPQFITVLSDFGETEKFVIEGDSLLLHAFSDPALSWSHGGQFLHLTFIVETFLNELVERGAHFCVVFFESHKAIWHGDACKCVARALLICHLQQSLPATHTTSVEIFESPSSEEWTEFFDTYLPCMVVASDELPAAPKAKISPVRGFLLDLIVAGVNVMLLRDIEILDHQVRAYYLPGRSAQRSKIGVSQALYVETNDVDEAAVQSFVDSETAAALDQDWASVALAWACSRWLATLQSDDADQQAAVKLLLTHAVLLRRGDIPLAHRAHMLCPAGGELSEFQNKTLGVLTGVMRVLAESAWCKNEAQLFGTTLNARTKCDLVDGRLLLSLAAAAEACGTCTAEGLGLTTDATSMAATLWKSASPKAEPLLPLKVPGSKAQQDCVTLPLLAAADEHELCAVGKGSLLAGILEPMGALEVGGAGGDRDTAQGGGGAGRRLRERGWKIEEMLPSFIWTHCRDQTATDAPANSRTMSEWERRKALRRKARQNQMYFRHLHEYAASLTGTTVLGATSISASAEASGSDADSQDSTAVEVGSVVEEGAEEDVGKGGKGGKDKKGGGKEKKPKEKKLSKKEQMLLDIAAKKAKGTENKLEGEWKELLKSIQASTNSVAKIKDLDDFCRRCQKENQHKLAMQVALQRLRECREAWADDREGHQSNMKFAILTMENVRTLISVHEEALRDVKSAPAAEARTEVVETMIMLGFIDAAMQVGAPAPRAGACMHVHVRIHMLGMHIAVRDGGLPAGSMCACVATEL